MIIIRYNILQYISIFKQIDYYYWPLRSNVWLLHFVLLSTDGMRADQHPNPTSSVPGWLLSVFIVNDSVGDQ